MYLDVITATDDGLSSTTQRHDILQHGDSVHDSFSYRERPSPSLILTSRCVRSTGWCAETVGQKKNDSLLAFSLDTHTLNLSLQLHINCPSFETSVQLKQIKNQESCDCYLASMTFLRGNDARFYVWSLCQEMIKLPE